MDGQLCVSWVSFVLNAVTPHTVRWFDASNNPTQKNQTAFTSPSAAHGPQYRDSRFGWMVRTKGRDSCRMASSHATSKHCAASFIPCTGLSTTACTLLDSSSSRGTLITMVRRTTRWKCVFWMSWNFLNSYVSKQSLGPPHTSMEHQSEALKLSC